MIETLTTAVIVLAISLVGLASITYGVLLSDQNKRIARIKKEFIVNSISSLFILLRI